MVAFRKLGTLSGLQVVGTGWLVELVSGAWEVDIPNSIDSSDFACCLGHECLVALKI